MSQYAHTGFNTLFGDADNLKAARVVQLCNRRKIIQPSVLRLLSPFFKDGKHIKMGVSSLSGFVGREGLVLCKQRVHIISLSIYASGECMRLPLVQMELLTLAYLFTACAAWSQTLRTPCIKGLLLKVKIILIEVWDIK